MGQHAAWNYAEYHFPRNAGIIASRTTIERNNLQPKPFIIPIAASEHYESSWHGGRMKNGRHVSTDNAEDFVSFFTVRMIAYMFGDEEKNLGHEPYNAYKSIAHQYYMTLDSINLQNVGANKEGQHAVMTSNCE